MRCQHAARFCFAPVVYQVWARIGSAWRVRRCCAEHASIFAQECMDANADSIAWLPILKRIAA